MSALEVTADVDRLSENGPSIVEPSSLSLNAKTQAALLMLLEALEYVRQLDANLWDFAVEISDLRRLKLSNSDLRWLVGRGLADHAVEVTLAGEAERSFRQPPRLLFCKKTCFVITTPGAQIATLLREGRSDVAQRSDDKDGLCLPVATSPLGLLPPNWDRDRQQLRVGAVVVKQFKVPAPNQEIVLAAFEEEGWPPRIDDPLPPTPEQSPKTRLQDTIKSLNRHHKWRVIRFLGDGSGEGVRWDYCEGAEDDSQ